MTYRTDLLRELIASLRDTPADWRWTYPDRRFSIEHIRSGVQIWTAVGDCHVDRPRKITFGFWGRLRLRSAFRHWRRVRRKDTISLEAENARFVLAQFLGIPI